MTEIDYSAYDRDGLLRLLRHRDRQAAQSRDYWIRAARKALDGDARELRNRVELATMGSLTLTNGEDEIEVPGYRPAAGG